MRSYCVILLALQLLSATVRGQDTTVTVLFTGEPFAEVVRTLEATTPYRFFYNTTLDTFHVHASAEREPVATLLQRIFQPTPHRFIMDGYTIYVTRQEFLISAMPADFFNRTNPFATPPPDDKMPPPTGPVPQRKLAGAVENRVFEIGTVGATTRQRLVLTGYIRDEKNGEPLVGAAVSVDSLTAAVLTDGYGYYSLTLPPGRHVLRIGSGGMRTTARQVLLRGDGRLDVELATYIPSLKEVIVSTVRVANVRGTAMGQDRLSAQTIKQVPVVFGEADVLRAVLALPGVTSAGEANTGLNVRGGAANQNLILLDDATVYNPSHLFGFFSAFNPDVVKGVELYKSVVPEKYGGRLSSVLDVTTKQGNTKKLSGLVGIGPLTGKAMVEGPLNKGRTTFVAGVRSTYSNWLLNLVPDKSFSNSRASFYDGNLHLTHTANEKNTLFLNGYVSHDNFRLNGDTLFRYGNQNVNLKWKHNFGNRFSAVFTAGRDRYHFSIGSETVATAAYRLSFALAQNHLRADFTHNLNPNHAVNFGLNAVHYTIQSGWLKPAGEGSLVTPDKLQGEKALETAVYVGDEYTISPKFSVRAGVRFSLFNGIGPRDQYVYREGLPRSKNTVVDTVRIGNGRFLKTYAVPEIRLSARLALSENTSIKVGVNTTAQYIHTLSNTNTILPTDVFKLSDAYIRPQRGAQVSAGLYRNLRANTIETSLEVYYRRTDHYLDVKSGATLIMNRQLETDVVDTRAKAYGAELLVRKTTGKLTGWLGYSYSRVFWQTADVLAPEIINNGAWYPANFDKPHNANLNGNYKFSNRFSMSWAGAYSTGRPLTLPLAVFNLGGGQRVFYSERNQFRAPDYLRADVSFSLEGNHKTTKATHNSWSVGVYNLTGRRNVYSIYFTQENGVIKGYELSIFGAPIPFLTYTLRF